MFEITFACMVDQVGKMITVVSILNVSVFTVPKSVGTSPPEIEPLHKAKTRHPFAKEHRVSTFTSFSRHHDAKHMNNMNSEVHAVHAAHAAHGVAPHPRVLAGSVRDATS
jgi:hypothetical protein